MITNVLLLIDLILALVFYGPITLFKSRSEFIWEACIQFAFFGTIIYYFSLDPERIGHQMRLVQFMSILLLARLPIISVLLMELHDLKVIFETGRRMLSSFMTILFSLYLFLLTYQIIGQGLYSGVIQLDNLAEITNSAGNLLYYQLNFNDCASGMLTLFCILTSNNWNATTEMYAVLRGTSGPYYFFSIYYVLSIMVMVNIIVSFIMEIYSIV